MSRRQATRASESGSPDPENATKAARREAQARVKRGGALYWSLMFVSWVMKVDILLFGRLRSGPFFALLRKTGAPPLA